MRRLHEPSATGGGPSGVAIAEPPRRGGYPPIGDYGLIGDGHTAALVSRAGSIDWACLPQLHSASVFGRLLDWRLGGYCAISPTADHVTVTRRYLDQTLVLETTFTTPTGTVRLTDCFPMRQRGARRPDREILRVIDGVEGVVALRAVVAPRFDYGELAPWVRAHGPGSFSALGGDQGLLVASDLPLVHRQHTLAAEVSLRAGQRRRLALTFVRPTTWTASFRRPRPSVTGPANATGGCWPRLPGGGAGARRPARGGWPARRASGCCARRSCSGRSPTRGPARSRPR